jgi:inhibitor of KinA
MLLFPIKISPLGDQAILTYWSTEVAAQTFAVQLRAQNPGWLQDAVPAYSSVGIFFDRSKIRIQELIETLRGGLEISDFSADGVTGKTHLIPCCYEMQKDMSRVCDFTRLNPEQVIERHTSVTYTVYAIGFSPGFPYLGYLPEALQNVPRLDTPRLRLEAGSVGMTGKQTGVYPLVRPGGWNIVGRTPLVLVDVEDRYFPIEVGDAVKFARIDEKRFRELEGERLN